MIDSHALHCDGPDIIILVSFNTAPSEVPRNFRSTVVNASTVQLTWQPPSDVHHNGDLFDFVITYRNDNGSSVSVFEARVNFVNGTADYELTLSNLETYNTYTLTVAARNMAGIGPRSIIQIRTPEDGEDNVMSRCYYP